MMRMMKAAVVTKRNMLVLFVAWVSLALMNRPVKAVAVSPEAPIVDEAGLQETAEIHTTTNDSWSTLLHVQLSNDYETFSIDSCPKEAFENLRVELFSWVQDELLSIFGTFSNLSEFQFVHDPDDVLGKHVPLQAKYECKVCGRKQWSSDRSMHNIAFLLQWFTQMALDDWIVDNQELLDGCMDIKVHVLVNIEKLGVPSKVYIAAASKFSKSSLDTLSLFQK